MSGLVIRQGQRYTAIPASDDMLEERIARPAGTLGKGERRRQQHAVERALYAGSLILAQRFHHDLANLRLGDDLYGFKG